MCVRYCVSLSVRRNGFECQSLCARFCREGSGGTETILMLLDRGRFVVVHSCSTFSDCSQLSTPLNTEVQKTAKIGGFSPPEGGRINRLRRILARKRIPWVCYSTPNLALIGKSGAGTGAPEMSKFSQNCGFWPPETDTMNTFR